jgi:acyl-coenzyme A thioesterase PaaI-like protein
VNEQGDEGPSSQDPRRRLAESLRQLITLTVSAEVDDVTLAGAADAVEGISSGLVAAAGSGRSPRRPPDFADPPQEYFPGSPATGMINPISPPIRVWRVEAADGGLPELRGEVNFDYQFEGPPACVHGGVIAETFDEVLGTANLVAGNPAMTGTLTIRYRKTTPLCTDLRIEGRCLGRSGRKVRTWGGIYHGDVLTAEAEGIFIMVRPANMAAIVESNPNAADAGMLEAIQKEIAATTSPKRD